MLITSFFPSRPNFIFQEIFTSPSNNLNLPVFVNLHPSLEIFLKSLYLKYSFSLNTYVTTPSPLSSFNVIALFNMNSWVSFLFNDFPDNVLKVLSIAVSRSFSGFFVSEYAVL